MTKLEQKLLSRVTILEATITEKSEEISWLSERISYFERQFFGSKKETVIFDSSTILPGFEGLVPDKVEKPIKQQSLAQEKKPRKKRGPFNQFDFPKNAEVKVEINDLSEDEKVDPITGQSLICIGEDIVRQLARVKTLYIIKETHTKKYSLPSKPELGVITAAKPAHPIPGSRADISLLVYVLVCKYADHLPLYRICEIFRRDGLKIPRQTLSKWVIKLGEVLEPLGELLKKEILSCGRIFTDDSTINLQVQGKGKLQQARIWTYVGGDPGDPDPPLVWFEFTEDRKHQYTEQTLENFKGVFHADAYAAYPKIDQKPGISWQACWVHARRYFFNVTNPNDFCLDILARMDDILEKERQAWEMNSEQRYIFRLSKTKKVVDKIFEEVKIYRDRHPMIAKGNLKKAIDYLLNYEKNFKVFLEYANARIENNVAERAIRPMTIGRKNWLFIGSMNAGKSAATIMSLIQTCRRLEINPEDYLTDVFSKLPNLHEDHHHTLLPHNWKK